jgi:excisionase family DNA binding protein
MNLMSIGEVSEKLGVSIGTLREWQKDGRITPFLTPGKHRRYSSEAIKKLMGEGLYQKNITRSEEIYRSYSTPGEAERIQLAKDLRDIMDCEYKRITGLEGGL